MLRKVGLSSLASLAVVAVTALAGAMAAQYQDKWAAEKKDPKFADVDWDYKPSFPDAYINAMAPAGPALYDKYCVHCHGATGDGKGDLSPMLIPPPRDFTKGIFKGRSSHPDMPPTSTDLMRSLIHGIPLSGMLSYSFIDTPQQVSLIGHVTNLAAGHFPKGYGFPLKSGNFHRDAGMPFPTPETIARGRSLFERFSCNVCHGEKGDGKSEARVANTLTDSVLVHGKTEPGAAVVKEWYEFQRPSSVRDFTQGIYSGGPNVRHMYLRVSGGVQGTVMPPFATSASTEDRWALAHYVLSLSKRSEPLPLPHSEFLVVKKAKALPAAPDDPQWESLKSEPLPPQEPGPFMYPIQPVYVLDLYFQQLRHNKGRPYFTPANVRALHDGTSIAIRLEWEDSAKTPDDRIELQLSTNRPPGFVIYGSAADPVNLWRWEGKAPGAASELDAAGPFTEAARPASNVKANGVYNDAKKRWAVVLTRTLAGAGDKNVPITIGDFNPFSVLMRDGGEAWPQGTREVKEDPADSEFDRKRSRDMEAERVTLEKAIEAKFKDLPRHLTTWHHMRLQ